ncbi:uncharacterized protein LOC111601359 [Drosophila hydei]|uniref:Uncharacterized protein LOC111601359 n=1 Tax=Drosophila hydei TaxID=7224 RepID=A0A6J1M9N7_DROHY|nr:uncharacterized protein LOC111601359 [Drosophila hydei]
MKSTHSWRNAPTYQSGNWYWDKKSDSLHFEAHNDLKDEMDRYIETNGYKFLRTITTAEEVIFHQNFARPETSYDYETIVSIDVRNLVLFLMPKEFLTKKFIEFMHTTEVSRLLNSLIMYFAYFLRLVELILIRRDELNGNMGIIQSEQTVETRRMFSIHLSQYRMLVGRNYSVILMDEGKVDHSNKCGSITISDNLIQEQFLAVATQIVWISMHRMAYDVIEMEMNRLFRSEHFIINKPGYLKFTAAEKSLLYGRRNKIVNCLAQVSPLIQELEHVPNEDLPILWIGERKYCGTDIRIATLELEYIVPNQQLHLIDVSRGIMGHPKRFYDTLLNLNWSAVREEHYSLENDPYHILRQPHLQLPNINEPTIRIMSKHCEHFLKLHRMNESISRKMLSKWLRRESIISSANGMVGVDIYNRCKNDLADSSYGPPIREIISNYFKVVTKLRKE